MISGLQGMFWNLVNFSRGFCFNNKVCLSFEDINLISFISQHISDVIPSLFTKGAFILVSKGVRHWLSLFLPLKSVVTSYPLFHRLKSWKRLCRIMLFFCRTFSWLLRLYIYWLIVISIVFKRIILSHKLWDWNTARRVWNKWLFRQFKISLSPTQNWKNKTTRNLFLFSTPSLMLLS